MREQFKLISLLILISVFPFTSWALPNSKLERFFITEGNFFVLLSNPQRIVTPVENDISVVTDFSYFTYLSEFDIAYTVSYSNWQKYKENERKKYGRNIFSVEEDLNTTIDGIFYNMKHKIGKTIKTNWGKDIRYKNFPGKDVEFEFYSNDLKYIVKSRAYIIDDQSYTLTIVFPAKNIDMTQYENFLNSFELRN